MMVTVMMVRRPPGNGYTCSSRVVVEVEADILSVRCIGVVPVGCWWMVCSLVVERL